MTPSSAARPLPTESTRLLVESNELTYETEGIANDALSTMTDQNNAFNYVLDMMGDIASTNRSTVEATREFAEAARRKTRGLWITFCLLTALNISVMIRIIMNGRIL